MHVPDKAGGDGNKPSAAFTQTAGEEQLPAEGEGIGGIMVDVFPLCADPLARQQWRGVVALDQARILLGEIEGVRNTTIQRVKGLLLERAVALHRAAGV